jgi:hypothetical protein
VDGPTLISHLLPSCSDSATELFSVTSRFFGIIKDAPHLAFLIPERVEIDDHPVVSESNCQPRPKHFHEPLEEVQFMKTTQSILAFDDKRQTLTPFDLNLANELGKRPG